jgi:hypothetical protein
MAMANSWSRMQRVQEKQNVRKVIFLGVIIVVMLALAVTLGFTILTKMFVLLGSFTSSFKGVEKADYIPPSPPYLISDFDATNSGVIAIRGRAEVGANVYLSLGKSSETASVVGEEGTFVFSDIQLNEGKNVFTAWAIDAAGNKSQNSQTLTINFSQKTPKLEITSPSEGKVVTGQEAKVEVSGKTDPENKVTVNERVAIVATSGSFITKIGLNSGQNLIKIVVVDPAGNIFKKEVSVVYNP